MHPFQRHVNHVYFPKAGEDSPDMILGHIPGQPPSVLLGGYKGTAPFSCPFLLSWVVLIWNGNASCCPVYTRKECDSGCHRAAGAGGCAGTSWAAQYRGGAGGELVPPLPLAALWLLRVLSPPPSFSLDSLEAPFSLERFLDFSSEQPLHLVGGGGLVLNLLSFSLTLRELIFFTPEKSILPSEVF